jgi:hypothetical protein
MNRPVEPSLLRVVLSKDDMARAMEFIESARRHAESSIEYEACLLAAIIHYARPFTNNEGPGQAAREVQRLSGVDVNAVLAGDPALIDLHNRIVRLRMKAVAHSESSLSPAQHIPLTIGNPGTRGVSFVRKSWHVFSEQLDLAMFHRMATAMHGACMNRVFEHAIELGVDQRISM